MKIIKFSIIFTLIFTYIIFPQEIKIRSLQAYPNNNVTALPVITVSNNNYNQLTIEFDVKAKSAPNLIVVFRFSDSNWEPYDNLFLSNFGKDRGYRFDYDELPTSVDVNEANYHYKGKFPSQKDFVSFPFSGNWRFYITDYSDTSKVYAQGKFYVVDNNVVLNASIKKDRLERTDLFPTELTKIFNIETRFILPEKFFSNYVDQVRIIENKKINNPIIIDRNFNTDLRQYYWDANSDFRFIARDIQPGNEYRQLNLMNFNKFNSKNVNAQFEEIEYSRFFQLGRKDLNGGEIFKKYNNTYSTYLNVKFTVRPPDEIYNNVYLVGAFNDWKILPQYKMKNEDGLFSITKSLKRGRYDYQYVVENKLKNDEFSYDWFYLEGNFWETSNIYHIFLYYKDTHLGGFDRIIGHTVIKS